MSISQWDRLDMDSKIARVLDVESHEPSHHFGRPFLTPYQIAIRFEQLFPGETREIGKPRGGRGTGQQDSLAQYIALELSRRIRDRKISRIEGRFLYRGNLRTLAYEVNGEVVESSLLQAYDLSMYRLVE